MFNIQYRIVIPEYEDDISGMDGFIKISSNNHSYGDIYPKEIEQHMSIESIYYWLSYFMQAAIALKQQSYILISDIESYNSWIEIRREKDIIYTSVIHADKPEGTTAIEFTSVPNIKYTDWTEQETNYSQFEQEVINNSTKYYEELCELNSSNIEHKRIKDFYNLLKQLTEIC